MRCSAYITLNQCYSYNNDNAQFDISVIDPSLGNVRSHGMSLSYDSVRNLTGDTSDAIQVIDLQGSSQSLLTSSRAPCQRSSTPPESSRTFRNIVNFSSQASKMKRLQSASFGPVPRANLVAEKDPESIEIKRLRRDKNISWTEIAQRLNKQRIAKGKHPRFTSSAVYGRFACTARRIAAANGELWESDNDKEQRPKKKLKGETAKAKAV